MRIRPPPRNSDSTQGNQSAKRSIFATIFEKLFGKRDPVKLAYAASDDAGLGVGELAAGRYDEWTAVYNISAHIVYMPDGTQRKRIRASAACSTTRATSMKKCTAPLRRMSTISNCGKSFSMGFARCG
jgi:hypothetical protein